MGVTNQDILPEMVSFCAAWGFGLQAGCHPPGCYACCQFGRNWFRGKERWNTDSFGCKANQSGAAGAWRAIRTFIMVVVRMGSLGDCWK